MPKRFLIRGIKKRETVMSKMSNSAIITCTSEDNQLRLKVHENKPQACTI